MWKQLYFRSISIRCIKENTLFKVTEHHTATKIDTNRYDFKIEQTEALTQIKNIHRKKKLNKMYEYSRQFIYIIKSIK